MEENTDPQSQNKEAVVVSKDGQMHIPRQIREKLGIKAPGRIIFRETESGDVMVEAVRSPSEMRGFAAEKEPSTDKSATKLLYEFRERSRARDTPD